MRFKLFAAALLAALGLTAVAGQAFADDDLRAQIREEIKAYEKEQKADPKNDKTFKVYWSDGLRLKTADGKIKLKIGGRIMLDTWGIDDDGIDDGLNPNSTISNSPSGVEFRRVRFYNSGEIGKHFEFKLQLDFTHNDVLFRDVYVGFKHLRDCWGCGVPNIKIGHFKVAQGLEQLTSSRFITFMERAMITNLFPNRSTGVQLWDTFRGGRLGYQLGVDLNDTADFEDGNQSDGDGSYQDGLGYTGRVWWTPWAPCHCKAQRLHLGASLGYRDDVGDGARLRARPPSHLYQRIVDTRKTPGDPLGSSAIDNAWIYGVELAWVYGPWSVQAEYAGVDVSQAASGDPSFSGWYAEASYWITGESRNYVDGVFKRTKPCCNFLDKDCCCKGGWQLAARYEEIDLTDAGVAGGEATAYTFGVNWLLNPNARIMFNYMWAETTIPGAIAGDFTGDTSAFGMRFQVDW